MSTTVAKLFLKFWIFKIWIHNPNVEAGAMCIQFSLA